MFAFLCAIFVWLSLSGAICSSSLVSGCDFSKNFLATISQRFRNIIPRVVWAPYQVTCCTKCSVEIQTPGAPKTRIWYGRLRKHELVAEVGLLMMVGLMCSVLRKPWEQFFLDSTAQQTGLKVVRFSAGSRSQDPRWC